MVIEKNNSLLKLLPKRDYHAYLALISVSILARIPFLKTFDLVAYDGTYYIKLAKSVLRGTYPSSVFPIGYPAFIALFIPLLHDGVRAAQVVSFIAALGTLLVLYSLSSQFVKKNYALAASLVLAVTPLFIRISMMTLSESLYTFWVLLGLLCFSKHKEFFSGLCMGVAAITRPEAIGIFIALGILRLRNAKRLSMILAGFVILYSVNVLVQSNSAGRIVVVPKARLFGTSAEDWKLREKTLEFPSKEETLKKLGFEEKETNIIADYFNRLPQDLLLLIRHASLIIFLLALYGIYKKRLFLLALFVPFFIFPPFTLRSEPRFILPYIPGLILYTMIGISGIRKHRVFVVMSALLSLSVVTGIVINRDQLVKPVSDGYQWTKRIGRSFKDQVAEGDKIADRKPFFPFYAGGEYFEIPLAPIDMTLEYLAANNVKYLALNPAMIHSMRSQLLPLLYDITFIKSELRYSQVLYQPEVMIYRKEMDSDPLKRRILVPQQRGLIYGPAWSPDGEKIAYRLIESSGEGKIYSISPVGGQPQQVITGIGIEDPISWSPDSEYIAFASDYEGNMDIFVYNTGGKLERITSYGGKDISPSWSRDGREIVFCSDRSGRIEIWVKNLDTGICTQITTGGGYSYPSISPDGKRIAWIRVGEGLYIFNRGTGTITRAAATRRVNNAPAWSPDGRYVAVTGNDWGKTDVYILTLDGYNTVLLTKTVRKEGQPTWSPDNRSIATVTSFEGATELCILTGIEPYKDRLITLARSRESENFYNR